MANDLRIVISGAYLNKTVYQDIVKGLKQFGDAIKIPISIDTKNLDKSLQSIKLVANEQGVVTNATQKYNVELGKTIVLKTKIRNAMDSEGKLLKDVNGELIKEEKITSEVLINQKEINKERQKELSWVAKQITETQKLKKENAEAYQNVINKNLGISNTPQISGTVQGSSYVQWWEKQTQSFEKAQIELKKLKENALTTNAVLKNFGGENLHKKADEFNNSLQKLNLTENMTQKEMQETIIKARELSNSLANVSREAKSTGNNSMTMGKMIGTAFEKFSIWIGVTTIFFGLAQAVRTGITSIVELDTSLTELNKVADLTNDQLISFTNNAYEAGKTLGRTGKEVIDATTEFKRAGFTMQESFDLSQQALLLTNIGDGITDVKEAAGSIIAVLRGYQMEASNTAHVVDLLNEVSNNYAVDTNNLTNGLQRSSGTLSQTGTSVEELTGLLTGGYEALRNMEKVSTGLITISQRLRGVSEDGEEIDGLFPKLQKDFKEIANVDIQKTNGQLRSTYDIIKDLAQVWDTLNDEQRQRIGELASGVRQAPVLNAIIQNWKNVEGASKDAMNSMGSAIEENEKYLNSIGGKIKNFTSSLQLMWKNTISSDFIKFIVDAGSAVVTLIDKIGILNIVLLGLTGFISGKLLIGIPLLTDSIMKLAFSMGITNNAMATFATTLSGMLVVGGILLAVAAFDKLYVSASEQKQKVSELTTEFEKLKSEIDKFRAIENPTESQKEYLALLEDELNIKRDILEIEKEMAAKKEVFGEGAFGGGLKEKVEEQLNHLRELQYQEERMRERLTFNPNDKNAIQNLKNINNAYKEITLNLIESKKTVDDYMNSLSSNAPKELKDKLKSFSDELNNNINNVKKLTVDVDDNTQSQKENTDVTKQSADASAELASETTVYTKELQKITTIIDDVNKAMKEYNDTGKLSASTIVELISKYPELIGQLKIENGQVVLNKDAILNLSQIEMNSFIRRLESEKNFTSAQAIEVNKRINKLADEAMAYEKAVQAQRTAMSQMFPGENWVYGGVNPYESERQKLLGQLQHDVSIQTQIDAIRALAKQARSEGASAGGKSSGGSSASSSVSEALIEKDRYAALNQELEHTNQLLEENKTLQEGTDLQQRNKLIEDEIKLLKQKQDNLHAIADEQRKEREELRKSLSTKGVKFTGSGDTLQALNAQIILQKKLDEVNKHRNDKDKTYYNQLKSQYDILSKELSRFIDIQVKQIPQAGIEWQKLEREIIKTKQEMAFEVVITEIDKYNSAIDSLSNQLSNSEKRMKLFSESSEEYRNELNNQINLLQQLQAEGQNEIKYIKSQLESEQLSIEQKKELTKTLQELTNAQLDYQLSIEELKRSIQNTIADKLQSQADEYIDELNKRKDEAINSLRELIEQNKDDFNFDEFVDGFDNILIELDNIDKKVAETVEHIDSTDNLREKIQEYKSDIIEIKQILDGFKNVELTGTSEKDISDYQNTIEEEAVYLNEIETQVEEINKLIADRQELYKQEEYLLQNQLDLLIKERDEIAKTQEEQIERQKELNEQEEKYYENQLNRIRTTQDVLVEGLQRQINGTEDGKFLDVDEILMSIIKVKNELDQVTNTDLSLNVNNAMNQLDTLQGTLQQIRTENGIDINVENVDSVLDALNQVISELNTIDGSQADIGVGADISEALARLQVVQSQFSFLDGELIQLYVNLNTESFYSEADNVVNAISFIQQKIDSLNLSNIDVSNPNNLKNAIQQTIYLSNLLNTAESRMQMFDSGGNYGGSGENPRVEEIEKEKDAIKERYDTEIDALKEKLELLDEEADKEDRLLKLRELEDELYKTKNDKRFSYITAEGEEILTYNKERVSELENERDELIKQYEREDLKKSIRDEIERLELARDEKLEILDKELDDLKKSQDNQTRSRSSFNQKVDNQNSDLQNKLQEHLSRLQELYDEEVEKQQDKLDEITDINEKELTEQEKQNEDILKNKDDEIKFLEDNLNKIKTIHQQELDALQQYKQSLVSLYQDILNDINDKIDKIEKAYDKEIIETKAQWDELIKGVRDGTIDYDELMDSWYGDSIDNMEGFVSDISEQIEEIKDLYESLSDIEVNVPDIPLPNDDEEDNEDENEDDEEAEYDASDGWQGPGYYSGPWDGLRYYEDEDMFYHGRGSTPPSNVYHSGGIVGEKSNANPQKMTKLINKLFNAKPNEEVVKALKNELFIPENNIQNNFIPNLKKLFEYMSGKSALNNLKNNINLNNLPATNQSSSSVIQKIFNLKDITIKSDNIEHFLDSIDVLITSHGG